MSVRPSVCMEQLSSLWTVFCEIWYLSILRKSVEKIQVPLKSDKNNGYFTWKYIYTFLVTSRSVFLRIRNVSKTFVQKIKTHILCSTASSENTAVYEMWENIVEPDRPQMTIWRMRIACWIPKATNIHSDYVLLTAFPLQHWLYECASMFGYTCITCLVKC